jgi:hypothetical protein
VGYHRPRGLDLRQAARLALGFGLGVLCVMPFNGVLNRLERYVLRWHPRERAAAARELQ